MCIPKDGWVDSKRMKDIYLFLWKAENISTGVSNKMQA
jgi:hypothetical protein